MPEIADGLVEITNVAREPGYRSKIAVISHADGVDPVGACVGPRGSRVRMVVSELRGEKIDIIPYNDEPARFVAKALSPARVREVLVDDENKQATVDRARRPALAGDRPRGPERPARRPPDRLARGHQVRDRVRGRGGRARLRGGGRHAGPLRRDPLQRPALPQRRAARLALLRPARPPGAATGTGSDHVGGPPRGGGEAEADERKPRRRTRRTAVADAPSPTTPRPRRRTRSRSRGSCGGRGRSRSSRRGAGLVAPHSATVAASAAGGRAPKAELRSASWRRTEPLVARPRREARRDAARTSVTKPDCARARRSRDAASPASLQAARGGPRGDRRLQFDDGQEARPRDRQGAGRHQQGGARGAQGCRHRGEGGRLVRRGGRDRRAEGLRRRRRADRRNGDETAAKAAPRPRSRPRPRPSPRPSSRPPRPRPPSRRPAAAGGRRRRAQAAPHPQLAPGRARPGRRRRRAAAAWSSTRRPRAGSPARRPSSSSPARPPPRRRRLAPPARDRVLAARPSTPARPRSTVIRINSGSTVKDVAESLGVGVARGDQEADGARARWRRSRRRSPTRRSRCSPTSSTSRSRSCTPPTSVEEEPELRRRRRGPGRPPAGRHDHGPRRPRQDLAARRHPRDRGRGRRGRRHHAAHRRLPGAPRRQGRSPSSTRPGHEAFTAMRARGAQRHRHRRDRGGRRRRRHAADRGGDRPRPGRRRADPGRGQQDRQGGRRPDTRARRAGPARPPARRTGAATSSSSTSRPRRKQGLDELLDTHPGRRRARGAQGQPRRRRLRRRDRVQARPGPRPGGDDAHPARHAAASATRIVAGAALGPRPRDARLPRPARQEGAAPASRSRSSASTACPRPASTSASSRTSARPASSRRSARTRLKTEALARRSGRKVSLEDVFTLAREGERQGAQPRASRPTWPARSRRSRTRSRGCRRSEVTVNVIHRGVGGINESDVMLAAASDGDHHRLQRAPGRRRRARSPSARASRSAPTRSSTRRSRSCARRWRACSSPRRSRRSSARSRSARSSRPRASARSPAPT